MMLNSLSWKIDQLTVSSEDSLTRARNLNQILERGILEMPLEYVWNLPGLGSAFSLGDASDIGLMRQPVTARAVEPSVANGEGSTDFTRINHIVPLALNHVRPVLLLLAPCTYPHTRSSLDMRHPPRVSSRWLRSRGRLLHLHRSKSRRFPHMSYISHSSS
jgi:hypothetical protein